MSRSKGSSTRISGKAELTRATYWLVSKNGKPIAFVRVGRTMANTVAGDKSVARDYEKPNDGAFTNGRPDTVKRSDIEFDLIGHLEVGHPVISSWIGQLGLPRDASKEKLDKWRENKVKKARADSLSEEELAKIIEMNRNAVSIRRLAERFGISEWHVRSITHSKPSYPTGGVRETLRDPSKSWV